MTLDVYLFCWQLTRWNFITYKNNHRCLSVFSVYLYKGLLGVRLTSYESLSSVKGFPVLKRFKNTLVTFLIYI